MLNVTSNYLRIEEKPNTGVYEYEVRFIPNVDMRNERFRLIRQIEPIIGDVRVSTKRDAGAYLGVASADSTVDSGNSKRLNSEQSLISKHYCLVTLIVL